MHDTLRFMQRDPIHRRWHHDDISFGLVYAFSERYVLPISHDEVVHGKGSLIAKMAGDDWQKFASLRLYLAFMWTHPGKKLLFMGAEFAQWGEWNHDTGLEWHLAAYDRHHGVHRLVSDLNRVYRDEGALHALDAEPSGFRWLIREDYDNSVFAYLRAGMGAAPILVLCNMTPAPQAGLSGRRACRGKLARAREHRCGDLWRLQSRQCRLRPKPARARPWRGAIARAHLAAAGGS